MLKSLHIRNYVLIESLHVNFNKGFVAITGETGSGKSILLDAFALLLGDRSDVKSIRVGQDKCTVEAVFAISKDRFDSFFQDNSRLIILTYFPSTESHGAEFFPLLSPDNVPVASSSILMAPTSKYVESHQTSLLLSWNA